MSTPPEQHGYIDFVGEEEHFWYARTLWEAARELPVREVPLDELPWRADGCHTLGSPPKFGAIADMFARAMRADLSYPVIQNVNGDIMDGMHRILKAHVTGRETIGVVRFERTPPPDRVKPRTTPRT